MSTQAETHAPKVQPQADAQAAAPADAPTPPQDAQAAAPADAPTPPQDAQAAAPADAPPGRQKDTHPSPQQRWEDHRKAAETVRADAATMYANAAQAFAEAWCTLLAAGLVLNNPPFGNQPSIPGHAGFDPASLGDLAARAYEIHLEMLAANPRP